MKTQSPIVKTYVQTVQRWSKYLDSDRRALAGICNDHAIELFPRMTPTERDEADAQLQEVL